MSVEAELQKWGNSVALRIPAPLLRMLDLQAGARVSVAVTDGALVVAPASPRYDVREMADRAAAQTPPGDLWGSDDIGRERS